MVAGVVPMQVTSYPNGGNSAMTAALATQKSDIAQAAALSKIGGKRRRRSSRRTKRHHRQHSCARRDSSSSVTRHIRSRKYTGRRPTITHKRRRTRRSTHRKKGGSITVPTVQVLYKETGSGNQTVNGNITSTTSLGANAAAAASYDSCLGAGPGCAAGK